MAAPSVRTTMAGCGATGAARGEALMLMHALERHAADSTARERRSSDRVMSVDVNVHVERVIKVWAPRAFA